MLNSCRVLIGLVAISFVVGSSNAKIAKSDHYTLEYGSTNAGSGSAQSASYSMVSSITSDGVAGTKASSASYSITPPVAENAASSVSDWSLY